MWLEKHPELLEERDELSQAADDPSREGEYDESGGIHIPAQSWYPFIASVGLLLGGYAVIYENWILGTFCFVVITFSTYAPWAFEGVGGEHIHPETGHPGRHA